MTRELLEERIKEYLSNSSIAVSEVVYEKTLQSLKADGVDKTEENYNLLATYMACHELQVAGRIQDVASVGTRNLSTSFNRPGVTSKSRFMDLYLEVLYTTRGVTLRFVPS